MSSKNYEDLLQSIIDAYKDFQEFFNRQKAMLSEDDDKNNKVSQEVEAVFSNLDFESTQTIVPNYIDQSQNIYRIRFSYAYALGYREMYRDFLNMLLTNREKSEKIPPLKILSIGCGDGIDCWAVHEVRRKYQDDEKAAGREPNNIYIEYTGVDYSPWNKQWYKNDGNYHVCYEQDDINHFLKAKKDRNLPLEQNVIVFAKVIDELGDNNEALSKLCGVLEEIDFRDENGRVYEEVYFLFFHRTKRTRRTNGKYNYAPYDIDLDGRSDLTYAMSKDRNGYHFFLKDIRKSQFKVGEGGKGKKIAEYDNFKDIYDGFYAELYKDKKESSISRFVDCLKKQEGPSGEKLRYRDPMLYDHNIYYEILTFKRIDNRKDQ